MKRSIQVVGGLGLAAGVILGVTPAASAHDTHPKHAEKSTCATHCRPAPLPKPAGGWPCAKTKTCGQKHHRPICPPTKPPVKPPVTPVPKPPHVSKPVVHHDAPATRIPTPQLALTGGFYQAGLEGGGVLLLMGGVLVGLTRQPRQYTKAAKR